MTLNRTFQLGNLGGTPTHYPEAGDKKARTTFSLAVDSGRESSPYWFRVVAFGKQAASAAEHLSKGDRVIVEGRLTSSSYEQGGEPRTSIQIVATNLQFVRVAKWQSEEESSLAEAT